VKENFQSEKKKSKTYRYFFKLQKPYTFTKPSFSR